MKRNKNNYQWVIFAFLSTALSCSKSHNLEQNLSKNEDPTQASALLQNVVNLSNQDRRSFLQYYAPVIFKQSNENDPGHLGYDWITNFYFDGESKLSNNKDSWENGLQNYIYVNDHNDWRIRPTLYTSIIQYYDKGLQKNCATLLYHVYHAKQNGSIHDWERIEIRINGITGGPGNGEAIQYVVITRHELHNARTYPHEDLNFMQTANGKHVMIWQADWDFDTVAPGWSELHFVEDPWSTINSENTNKSSAKVNVNGESGEKEVHYVFVCGNDPEAVSYWNAQQLTQYNALSLTSGNGEGTTIRYDKVKRIQYELQDQADILSSHLKNDDWKNAMTISMATPVLSENGVIEVPGGIQTFYSTALDAQDSNEDRTGYVRKHWFWGTYNFDEGGSFTDVLGQGPWKQHEYFVHDGTKKASTHGFFLGRGDYANWLNEGGFDGRWQQLFDDNGINTAASSAISARVNVNKK